MNKMIIFDFNGTIYDANNNKLEKDVEKIISSLGHNNILALISLKKKGRDNLAKKLVGNLFDELLFVKEKTILDYKSMMEKYSIQANNCIFIGDTLCDEIRIGKALGCNTIHINKAKKATTANFSVSNFSKINLILNKIGFID